MYKSFSMELAGRTLTVDVGRVAKQANGAAFMHYGDTVVLSTATASEKPRDGIDFFPLSVEYEEKMYAVGKIPGGFNKREGKASEHAILTSRVIDRPMRPLFPKDYRNDVTLNNMVMSVDPECDPEVVAMLGSAIATCISDIPFDGPCAMTQICNVTTLAPLSEAQKLDGLDEFETSKRYMHQYNFPSYSVGETKPSRGPGRREIGHGALAERALVPVLPTEEEFPYAIRTVSETFESNGSTSQASICASTMSLMAAGVPIKKPVAGISCGLVTGETDDDYLVLTDIQGLEDFFGDMDFKVAGTHDGITAIQMDIKIHGLTRQIVEEAIARTKQAREYILTEVMEKAIAEPRKTVGEFAPKIIQMMIDPQKIGEVVGQRGKTINAIIDETGVKIDITDDGAVSICGTEQAMMDQAKKYIEIIASDFTEGQILTGKVVSIKDFGAFLEFAPGKEGLVHISKLAKQRVEKVEDVVSLGDVVKVVCMGKDKMGRVSFSIKDVPADAK